MNESQYELLIRKFEVYGLIIFILAILLNMFKPTNILISLIYLIVQGVFITITLLKLLVNKYNHNHVGVLLNAIVIASGSTNILLIIRKILNLI